MKKILIATLVLFLLIQGIAYADRPEDVLDCYPEIYIDRDGTLIIGRTFLGFLHGNIYTGQDKVAAILIGNVRDVTIEDCVFIGYHYGILANNVSIKNLTIRNCKFLHIFGDAISINSVNVPAEEVVIENCYIQNPFSDSMNRGFGISFRNVHNGYVTDTVIDFAKNHGIHIENGCDNIWISGNLIRGVIGPLRADRGTTLFAGMYIFNSDRIWLYHNTLSDMEIGIAFEYGNNTSKLFQNNIINTSYAIFMHNAVNDPNRNVVLESTQILNSTRGIVQFPIKTAVIK